MKWLQRVSHRDHLKKKSFGAKSVNIRQQKGPDLEIAAANSYGATVSAKDPAITGLESQDTLHPESPSQWAIDDIRRPSPYLQRTESISYGCTNGEISHLHELHDTVAAHEFHGIAASDELDGKMEDNEIEIDTVKLPSIHSAKGTNDDDTALYDSGDDVTWQQDSSISHKPSSIDSCLIYEQLRLVDGEFRFLILHPARHKAEDIRCSLVNGVLELKTSSRCGYEALSYTWGDTTEWRTIFVNDAPFPVTPNLFVALKYLRRPESSRKLWIDAICIDQTSLLEKTHQVGLMKDIYKGASRVLVWLGESDMDIRKAITFLEQRTMFQLLTRDELEPFTSGLTKIFNRPWWSRMWVVQEVLVADQPPLLGCGRKWISWENVEIGISNLSRQHAAGEVAGGLLENPVAFYDLGLLINEVSSRRNGFGESKDVWFRRKQEWSLEELLIATCSRKTTQPHDKVFSLLGLTQDKVLQDVPIDYDQPSRITYQAAMFHILGFNRDFLVYATHGQKAAGIPSWCVDFFTPDWPREARVCGWERSIGAYHEFLGQEPLPTNSHKLTRGTLEIPGIIIGRLNYVHSSKCAPPDLTEIEKTRYRECFRAERASSKQREFLQRHYDYLMDDANAFERAIISALSNHLSEAEMLHKSSSDLAWKTMGSGAEPMLYDHEITYLQRETLHRDHSYLVNMARKQFLKYGEFGNRILKLIATISLNLIDKTLFTTSSGYVGQAPTAVNTIAVGDLLCNIQGCHVPAILRPEEHSNAYRLVTFSWVSNFEEQQLYGWMRPSYQKLTLC